MNIEKEIRRIADSVNVVEEIVRAPRDAEIVFDAAENAPRYMELRRFLWDAHCDMLAVIPARIVVSKSKHLTERPETSFGEAFGRYFYT